MAEIQTRRVVKLIHEDGNRLNNPNAVSESGEGIARYSPGTTAHFCAVQLEDAYGAGVINRQL